jgi:hypothetical protein
MNKRGDINWFIVTIIISLLTLAVFLIVIIAFPFQETLDRTACKESVILKATLPGDKVPAKEFINLRCKTRKVCVTLDSKGNCTSLGETFDTLRLTATEDAAKKEQIKMLVSREMIDCWEMLGEGKLEIFSRAWVWDSSNLSKGIICSRIEFDDSILSGKDKVDSQDDLKKVTGLMDYMLVHKVPNNNVSYMDFLRGTPEGQSAKEYYGSFINSNCTGANCPTNTDSFAELNLSKQMSILYVETTRTRAGSLWGTAILGVSGSLAGGYFTGSFTGAKILGGLGAAAGWVAGDYLQNLFGTTLPDGRNSVSGIFLTEYSLEGFKKYNIDSFENIY